MPELALWHSLYPSWHGCGSPLLRLLTRLPEKLLTFGVAAASSPNELQALIREETRESKSKIIKDLNMKN